MSHEAVHRLYQGVLYVQHVTQFHLHPSEKDGLPCADLRETDCSTIILRAASHETGNCSIILLAYFMELTAAQ